MTVDQLRSLGKDDLLNLFGLETRRTGSDYVLPALALLGAGVAIGVGVGLMIAPRSGKELREDITQRLQQNHDAPPVAYPQQPRATVVARTASHPDKAQDNT
jgi:hypothetical protein